MYTHIPYAIHPYLGITCFVDIRLQYLTHSPTKILALIRAHTIFLAPKPPFNIQHLHITHIIHQTFHMLIGLNQLPLCLRNIPPAEKKNPAGFIGRAYAKMEPFPKSLSVGVY